MYTIKGLIIQALILTVALGAYSSYAYKQELSDANEIIGYIFRDHCAPRGGVISLIDVKVIMDEIDPSELTSYLGCANDPDSGILVIQNDRVVYYVPEDDSK